MAGSVEEGVQGTGIETGQLASTNFTHCAQNITDTHE